MFHSGAIWMNFPVRCCSEGRKKGIFWLGRSKASGPTGNTVESLKPECATNSEGSALYRSATRLRAAIHSLESMLTLGAAPGCRRDLPAGVCRRSPFLRVEFRHPASQEIRL